MRRRATPRTARGTRARRVGTGVAIAAAAALVPATAAADELGCALGQAGWGTPRQDLALQVHQRLNAFRAENGLPPLRADPALYRASLWKSGHMPFAGYFAHADPPIARSPGRRAVACGFAGADWSIGENIAQGYGSPGQVMDGWANSPGHRANMLSTTYARVGVGVAQAGGRLHWTQVFSTAGGSVPTEPPPATPVARPDEVVVAQDSAPVTVPLLGNDLVQSGDPARVTAIAAASLGDARVTGDGKTATYTPSPGRVGVDRIAYTLTGLTGASTSAELVVRVGAQFGPPTDLTQLPVDPAAALPGGFTAGPSVPPSLAPSLTRPLARPARPRNVAPTARADRARLARGARRVVIPVLRNDRAGNGGRLRVRIVARPRHGVARVRGDRVVYLARRARGRIHDRLAYAAIDSRGARSLATLTIRRLR